MPDWDQPQLPFGHTYAVTPRPQPARRRLSPGQVEALKRVRETKREVRRQGSVFAGLDWSGTRCRRCGHACAGRHHPGAMGACWEPGCHCQMADVSCTCGHDASDHEPWGALTTTTCHECGCLGFGARPG